MIFPVSTPRSWRDYPAANSLSLRMLVLVHRYDGSLNSFPSMHVSVACLTALHISDNLAPIIGDYALLSITFPLLIGISSLFTKQHYVIDIAPGVLFGYLAYESFGLFAR
jgi:membrane-associated phospholipid phosphatase